MPNRTRAGVLSVIMAALLAACSGPAATPAATAGSPTQAASTPAAQSSAPSAEPSAAVDYLSMSQDELIAAAKAGSDIVFGTWWGEGFFKDVASKFTEKYGIQARVLVGDTAITKILAEKDREIGTIDVQLIGGADVKTSMDAGLWYGPIYDSIPDHQVIYPKLAEVQEGVQTGGYLVPIYRNQVGFVYDPNAVTDLPQTWDEFAAWIVKHPKSFAYPNPNGGGAGQAFVQAVIANLCGGLDKYDGDTTVVAEHVDNWNLAWDWLNANNKYMNVTLSNSEDLDLLNQGAATLVSAWDDDTMAAMRNGTIPSRSKMYIPQFGLPGGGDTAGVLKNASNKAAALLFIQFLTSPEIQTAMNETVGSIPARTDLTTIPSIIPEDQRASNGTGWMPAQYKDKFDEDFTKFVLK